jgi:ABC-2 type transport system permease protein
MAGLASGQSRIPASQQFAAIAYLRWRLFANSFRRKGGKGELVARLLVYPILLVFIIGPALGAGFGSWAAAANNHLGVISGVLWGITLLQMFISVNLSQPGLSFEPSSLIRFPVTFTRYLIVRLFLGLLSPATVIGTAALLSAALGVTVARPNLGWIAFSAAAALSLTNMLFIRMVFAWVDRWLSTRRAREIFTGFIILFSIGIQWANVTFNPGFNSRRHDLAESKRKLAVLMHLYHSCEAALAHFPPGAAGSAVIGFARGATLTAILDVQVILVFGALFLAVFAWRMNREYRGETFSDPGSIATPKEVLAEGRSAAKLESMATPVSGAGQASRFAEDFRACLYKEWIYVRRNTAQLYGMLAPLAMVFLFAGKIGSTTQGSLWTFPGAIAYATLGVAALSYNAFGLDAEGVQFYFLAPVRLRTVVLAKNVFSFAISALELLLVYVVLSYIAKPPSPMLLAETTCWLVFAVLLNVTVGNMRSIISPKKQDPSKMGRGRTSQMSALISLAVILLVGATGAGAILLGDYLRQPWLPLGILLVLAIAAAAFYAVGMRNLDALATRNQETMIEELCKAA